MNIQTLHNATADLGKIVIDVEGMTCASCVGRVERALQAVPGVKNAAVNLATERAEIIGPDLDRSALVKAIEDGTFLVLPHPEVLEMYRHKGADYDRWLAGMRRYQRTLNG